MTEGFDRERFEAWLALATFRRELRENRIARQWQASFTAWAAQGALLWQAKALPQPVVLGASAGLLVVHVGWLAWHQYRAQEDQSRMHYYHDRAARLASGDDPSLQTLHHTTIPTPAPKGFMAIATAAIHWPAILQFLTTLALALAVIATALASTSDKGAVSVTVQLFG